MFIMALAPTILELNYFNPIAKTRNDKIEGKH